MRIAMTMTLALLLTSCGGEEDFFDPNGNPVDTQLASGYWRLDYARTVDDDCFPESPDSRTSLVSYLPEGFTIDASTGSFQIEAVDYGTEGPVTCTLSGADFTCQPQRATPALGWTYQIVFSGRVRSSEQIQGQAAVKYLGLDPYNEEALGRAGIDFENCVSNMLLELTWSDWYSGSDPGGDFRGSIRTRMAFLLGV